MWFWLNNVCIEGLKGHCFNKYLKTKCFWLAQTAFVVFLHRSIAESCVVNEHRLYSSCSRVSRVLSACYSCLVQLKSKKARPMTSQRIWTQELWIFMRLSANKCKRRESWCKTRRSLLIFVIFAVFFCINVNTLQLWPSLHVSYGKKKTFASHLNMRTVIKSRWSSSQGVRFCLVIMTVIIAVSIGRSLTDSLRFTTEEKKILWKNKFVVSF